MPVMARYVASLVAKAKAHLAKGEATAAIQCLEAAQVYPYNLGEGKLHGAQENHLFYYLGQAYRALGDATKAAAAFERASTGLSEPTSAMYYNDQPPENVYFQGLALRDLGREEEARRRFESLVAYDAAHREDEVEVDYFAVSLPDFLVFDVDLKERNRRHCLFMAALGHDGLGQTDQRDELLANLCSRCPDHGAPLIMSATP